MRFVPVASSLFFAFFALEAGAHAQTIRAAAVAAPKWAAVPNELLPVLSRAEDLGPASGEMRLSIAVSLPFARPAEMQAFVDSVSDPRSPQYRHFLTPDEVGERFGPTLAEVERIADYLRANGFEVTLVSRNRLAVLANGTVAQAEAAFHTTIRDYSITPQDAVEPSRFSAYSSAIQLPADIADSVIDVSGLETYTRPQPRTTLLTPTLTRGLYDTATLFTTGDTGTGRTVGVSNFDGFRSASWLSYISHFTLPVPVGGAGSNITVVAVSGGGSGAGAVGGEGDLDIQMELGMAPLANIRVYDSPPSSNLIAVLTAEVSDNACDVISESYGWQLPASTATAAHNQHVSMSAQGITYMAASGDSGTTLEPFSYPNYEPEVLQVGGTIANVSSPSGARITEVGWSGSGGGWSTNTATFNVRPSWQTGTGVPAINATNNHRLNPDVAFHAAGSGTGAYQFYTTGGLNSGAVGTSFASPMFAGSLAVIEQEIINLGGLTPNGAGKRRFGRMQDLIYAENGRADVWHDITSGSNGSLPSGNGVSTCTAGWDSVTGWGPLDAAAFVPVGACVTGGCNGGFAATCPGDDSGVPCPCGNAGSPGNGCGNSVFAGGGSLAGSGTPRVSADTAALTAGSMTGATCVFFQGSAESPASPVDDGLGCVSGSVVRLGTKLVGGNSAQFPAPGDPSISVRGAIPVAGGTYYYQCFYRNAAAGFCTPATSNRTSGVAITWVP